MYREVTLKWTLVGTRSILAPMLFIVAAASHGLTMFLADTFFCGGIVVHAMYSAG